MILNNDTYIKQYDNGTYLTHFNRLDEYNDFLVHCFTTRKGGVSTGECKSLNLGFNRNDLKDNVIRNYQLVAEALKIDFKSFVLSNQVHDNRIRVVTEDDRGKGLLKDSDIIGYDGLVTNIPNITLVTFYADCIPVFIIDPIKKAIALIHSGWRSTYKNITINALDIMMEKFNTDIKDLRIVIGPSICLNCFEIDQDVLDLFKLKFKIDEEFYLVGQNEKFYLDLQKVIEEQLKQNGIKQKQIVNSQICTKCNNEYYFSHRGDKGKTGSLCAMMQIKDK